jgi:ComF family protein
VVNGWRGLFAALTAGLVPCLLCGGASRRFGLCRPCQEELPYCGPACPVCALPLPAAPADAPCGRCVQRPPAFEKAFALCRYRYPVDRLIGALKFGGRLACGRTIGELMAATLADRGDLPGVIVPVPLHPARQRERGYNQAHELARPIARRLGLVLAPELLTRRRRTPPQTGLTAAARRRNVAGAFAAAASAAPTSLALVDDVMTTGSTLAAAATACRRAGVGRVEVWVAARADSSRPAR